MSIMKMYKILFRMMLSFDFKKKIKRNRLKMKIYKILHNIF